MGSSELRNAFNLGLGDGGRCSIATLSYKAVAGTQYSVLTFDGTLADGSRFRITGDQVRPNGDVIAVARQTAEQLLKNPQPYKVAT